MKKDKQKFNPYDPSLTERLKQRTTALNNQIFKGTGKKLCEVTDISPINSDLKKSIMTKAFINGRYYMLRDEWFRLPKPKTEWLSPKEMTLLRLKGHEVNEIDK